MESKNNMSDTLIYVHIPKTAGTTLSGILDRNYSKDQIYKWSKPENYAQLSQDKKKTIRVIKGHVRYGIHTHIDLPVKYFTMLRNPVDRVISHYRYVKGLPSHYLHETIVSKNMSLVDYATSGISFELNNGQLRQLYGLDGRSFDTVQDEHFEKVASNLETQFEVIGIQEEFDKSMLLFQKVLGWRKIFYKSKNVSSKRLKQPVDQSVRDIIAEYNVYGVKLYDFAKNLFERQLAQHVPNSDIRVKVYIQGNKLVNRVISL